MKESSTEPPQKKLKQARLPFQILSPPVVKNNESSPSQCKRKASEVTSSDDDVVINEINENKIKPVEKKAKVVNKIQEKKPSNDVDMEIEEEERNKKSKRTSNSDKKIVRTKASRKSNGKNCSKVLKNKNEETEMINSSKKPEVMDIIDLCDSPVKIPDKGKESMSTNKPKYENNTSLSEIEGSQSNDVANGEFTSAVSHPESEKDGLDTEDNISKRKGPCQEKEVLELKCAKLDVCEKVTDGNSQAKNQCNMKSSEEISTDKGKAVEKITSSDTVENTTNTSSSNKSSSAIKNSFKQSSIKDMVTSKSPKTANSNSSCKRTNEETSQETKNSAITEECLENTSSNNCSTPNQENSSKNTKEKDTDQSNLQTPPTANASITTEESSPLSGCDISLLTTPETDSAKKINKTPRRMTPKQLLKMKEKDEKRREKERLREEKERKKAEEKEEKLKLKKEKEEERLRSKQEKEDEKRKEKEEKEKKKQAELEKKNEEKRLKEEERRQKEEEKQAREEEKRKKDEEERKKKEEKRLKEEQKEAEKRKSAQAFASFFVKTETKPVGIEEDKESVSVETNFQPFEVKNDMRMAPLLRKQLLDEQRQLLDSVIQMSSTTTSGQKLYLDQIRSPSYICGSASRTWPPPDETDDEVIIIESEQPNEDMEIDENVSENKPKKRHHRAKLLQFHENRRPAYWGTWRKKSKHIRPRAPLNQDESMLEYEVDSDDEWEEPEDGESLKGSDDEKDDIPDEQYEEDDMFVPHGYLSDGEGEDEQEDQSPEFMKDRLKLLQMEFEAERSEKQQKLKPRLIGCVWICNSESNPASVRSQFGELFLQRRAVWDGPLPITVTPPLLSSPSTGGNGSVTDQPGNDPKSGSKKKFVKESLIPDIIKKMHGSRKKLSKLLMELMEVWDTEKVGALPSKKCLAMKIREMAQWQKPAGAALHCWFVKEDVRLAHGLSDLELPPPTAPATPTSSPATNITKFTKVLTTDERLKLLRESPAANKEVAKDDSRTPITPSQTPSKSVKTPTIKLGVSSPIVKKRVALITVGPTESPKKSSTTSMMNFVTKSATSGNSETQLKRETVKVEEKAKKRITPITLTSPVSKPNPHPPSSEDDCIIID